MAYSLKLIRTGLLAVLSLFSASAITAQNDAVPLSLSLASMIRNATYIERTPEFTDLYMIQTRDKGRQIVIYCNSAFCYRLNGHTRTV